MAMVKPAREQKRLWKGRKKSEGRKRKLKASNKEKETSLWD